MPKWRRSWQLHVAAVTVVPQEQPARVRVHTRSFQWLVCLSHDFLVVKKERAIELQLIPVDPCISKH